MSRDEFERDLDENALLAAHRATPGPAESRDAAAIKRARSAPRHRARRRVWKPPVVARELQPLHAQHAYDGHSVVS